jgi:hypothetical protein
MRDGHIVGSWKRKLSNSSEAEGDGESVCGRTSGRAVGNPLAAARIPSMDEQVYVYMCFHMNMVVVYCT